MARQKPVAFPQTVKIEDWMVLGVAGEAKVIKVETKGALRYLNMERKQNEWEYLWQEGKKEKGLKIHPKVVLVFGPSGSGKDVVTDTIEKELRDKVLHISSDWYYGPLGKKNGETVFINNYDHINAVDWELLKFHLKQLKKGYQVKAPVYEFKSHSRKRGKFKILKPKSIILVSGIMVAETLRDEANLTIGVDAPWRVCVERRIKRDIEERGRTREQCQAQIKSTVKGGYKQFVKPYIKMIERNRWSGQGEAILIDNSKNSNTPLEPARVSKHIYLNPINKLLER